MARALTINIRIEGMNDVLRAFRALPQNARDELRDHMQNVSRELARRVKAAGTADTRQSARAARSVKAGGGAAPSVVATNVSRLLFGSEFGMNRKSGWYAARRYFGSPGRQFRPHLGGGSYWFFRTADENKEWVARQWGDITDAVVHRWSA